MKKMLTVFLTAALLCGCAAGTKSSGGSAEEGKETSAEMTEKSFADEVDEVLYTELPPDFLSEDNQMLFKRAEYISFNALVSTGFNMPVTDDRKTTDFEESDTVGFAYETDYTYDEFMAYIESVFAGDALESIKESLQSSYFETGSGNLCWVDAARGTNIFYKDKTFELVSESDDKIEFKAVATYSQEGMYESEEEFKNSGMDGDYEWKEEYNFELTKTDDGWKFTRFEFWK